MSCFPGKTAEIAKEIATEYEITPEKQPLPPGSAILCHDVSGCRPEPDFPDRLLSGR